VGKFGPVTVPAPGDRAGGGPGAGTAGRRLSAEDLSILALETGAVAGHTCKVLVLDGVLDVGLLRSSIGDRLDRAPELRMCLREVGGEPWWVLDPRVDLAAHVVESQAAGAGDEPGFRAAVAGIFAQRLDRSRPLWQMDLISGLAGGASALIWRTHHALADGATVMRIARTVLWDEQPGDGPGTSGGGPGASGAGSRPPAPAGYPARHRLGGLLGAVREAPQLWLRSPFDGHIDARRSVAFASAGLAGLRDVAHATDGATVNDAVLTVVAGGLRRWLAVHHGHLGPVRVKVPVSLHGRSPAPGDDARQPGNRDSFFCLDLPLGTADPIQRLAAIHHATRIRKQDHDAQHVDALMRELTGTPQLRRFAEHVLAHPRSFALNVSNVPGPRRPVHVLGVPVRSLHSLAEIRERHALRIAVVSVAGTLNFGLVADPTLIPGVDDLASGMQAEAATLTSAL
jgi:diacylglycerol O-acyltransferase / wax synthase